MRKPRADASEHRPRAVTRDYPSLVAPVPSVVERDPSASREHGRPWRRLREPIRLALVWGVVAACAVAALATLPTQLRHAHSDIQVGTTRSRQERLEQPARTVGLTDLRIFETAARIIPKDAVYAVVVGRDAEISGPHGAELGEAVRPLYAAPTQARRGPSQGAVDSSRTAEISITSGSTTAASSRSLAG